ncbi:hypothetical protein WI76_03895 [Burkholderia ubonensis]|uniref:hypothetical protein n=1 Tax=Burkholderia ubonensis TaxID=101571 RepID=UPI00076CBA7E|nr:hypothetical protein [Burkholderia ubonensis]KVC92359.1 hypothetical protein WI76_03895 [Burkholderia ubonensis]
MSALRSTSRTCFLRLPDFDPEDFAEAFADSSVEAVEIPRPELSETGYADLVRNLVASPRFMCDFSQTPSSIAFPRLCRRILGEDAPLDQIARLLDDLNRIEQFARMLYGQRLLVSVRNWFAPGDLVWHVDRSSRDSAYRILWPLGRAAGMRVTPRDNFDHALYAAFMRREHPLLCRLDRDVAASGQPLEILWQHRHQQVYAMIEDDFPFLLDRDRVEAVRASSVSVHRIETPRLPGTYHRSAWANRNAPGLQIIITVTTT